MLFTPFRRYHSSGKRPPSGRPKQLHSYHRAPAFSLDSCPAGSSLVDSRRDLLFKFLRSLPVRAINAAYAAAVPICREFSTQAGYLDAFYINALGRLILAEFKLWRNPQARRKVIGQILGYTKELASWSYEDLQLAVSTTLKCQGNVPYDLVRARFPEVAAIKKETLGP